MENSLIRSKQSKLVTSEIVGVAMSNCAIPLFFAHFRMCAEVCVIVGILVVFYKEISQIKFKALALTIIVMLTGRWLAGFSRYLCYDQ